MRYQVDIIKESFSNSGDVHTDKTVCVSFLDDYGNIVLKKYYGLIEPKRLYSILKKGGHINISNLYVENFSLDEYRRENGLSNTDYIILEDFTAIDCFFEADEETNFSYTKFTGKRFNLSKTVFGRGAVNFQHTEFIAEENNLSQIMVGTGAFNFQFSSFSGNFSIENAEMNGGQFNFVNTIFNCKKINFKGVHFGAGDVEFHFAKFREGDVSFDKAEFGGNVTDFRKVEFGNGKLDFRRVDFGDSRVLFDECEFHGGRNSFKRAKFGKGTVSFEMCNFHGEDLHFEGASFDTGAFSFFKSKVGTISFAGCQLNNYLDLRVESAVEIDLSNTVVRDVIDMNPDFSKVEVDRLNIAGIRNLGRIILEWDDNKVYQLITSQENTSFLEKAEQFRVIKEDFNHSGRYNDEDEAYIAFKRFELKDYLSTNTKDNPVKALWVYPYGYFQKLVFDYMGLYATSPTRVFTSMVAIYCVFSLLYAGLPEIADAGLSCGGADNDVLHHIELSFYFSAITFLTIGYGDCLPEGHLKWLAPLEGWMGMFLMAYFTVAFVRKILR